RPGTGFGQCEGTDRLPARERWHEALPLLGRTEGEDRQRACARVHRDGDADARVRTRQLLEHEHVGEEVGAAAAVLLRYADAEQPDLAEALEQRAGEAVVAVPLRRMWLDLVTSELPCEPLDLPLLGRELEM